MQRDGEQPPPLLLPRLPGAELRISCQVPGFKSTPPPCVVSLAAGFCHWDIKIIYKPLHRRVLPRGQLLCIFSGWLSILEGLFLKSFVCSLMSLCGVKLFPRAPYEAWGVCGQSYPKYQCVALIHCVPLAKSSLGCPRESAEYVRLRAFSLKFHAVV